MTAYAKPYSGIPYLSNARSIIALEQIRDRAEEKGDAALAAEAAAALDDNAAWRRAIDGWVAQNRSSARQGGATYAIDVEADFVLGKIYGILDGLKKHRGDTDAGKAATRLVLDHFTDARGKSGVGVMSQVVYEEQLPRMRRMLAVFAAEPGLARLVRVADWIDDLREIEPRYAASLRATATVTWGDVIARRNTAYDSLFAVVGLIMAHHRRDPATLGYLLAPLDDQVARAAEQARRRRAGQSLGINEDELSAEELIEIEGVAEDVDGDGVPDAEAAEAQPPAPQPAADAPAPDAAPAPAGGPILRPLPAND